MKYIRHWKDNHSVYYMEFCDNGHLKKVYNISLEDINEFINCDDDSCRQEILMRTGPINDLLEDC